MSDEQRRLVTAYHESGHALMSMWLGRAVDIISIRPGEGYRGITIDRHPLTISAKDWASVGLPIPRLPARLRRDVEIRVLTLLAGELGAQLVQASGYDEHEAEALEALKALREPSPLTARQAARIAAAERGDEGPNPGDEVLAWKAARLLASHDDQADRYLGWLRSVAKDYVFHPAFAAELELIVPELLAHEVISGRRARQIIEAPREEQSA